MSQGTPTGIANAAPAASSSPTAQRTGIATAAHCPDELRLPRPGRKRRPAAVRRPVGPRLSGRADQPQPANPPSRLFYANRGAGPLRRLRPGAIVASTRAGDFVCHYGESSGYSCADGRADRLCAAGSALRRPLLADLGDGQRPELHPRRQRRARCSAATSHSASPRASTATPAGRCIFYYYMSTDYLPPPWRLLTSATSPRRPGRR